ncbi:DNA-directed RNA polymerase sigma-70 factor [Clostridia bacterium]|nr:DNA-directed RNA polymerase sigma-70 factor [Clostridia bacterium]
MTFTAMAASGEGVWYTYRMDTNQTLFEKLYERYAPEIKRFLFTIARRDAEAANDVFQNTWMNAWRYLGSLKEEGAARAWLYAIARNEAKRYYSARTQVQTVDSVSLNDEDSAYDSQDEEESRFPDAICDADQLKGLLAKLPEDDQQLLLLHYAYGIALTEVAELRGTNYNTVKSQLRRALVKLRATAKSQ